MGLKDFFFVSSQEGSSASANSACYISGLFPTFFLHKERGDGKKVFLMASRRRVKSAVCSVSDMSLVTINIYHCS